MPDTAATNIEIMRAEHEDADPATQKGLAYGWDSSASTKRRLACDSTGKLKINDS